MTRDHQHNPDPNENAARIVAGSTARAASETPFDREAGLAGFFQGDSEGGGAWGDH
jgi:hypothetical protein